MSRRHGLQLGMLAGLGLNLPQLCLAEGQPDGQSPKQTAKSCILLFLEGGPAHQDLWDLKPEAPVEIRGEFRPIHTSVAGIDVCEHLPLLAKQMQHVTVIRSVHHTTVDHNAGAYYALTGRPPAVGARLIIKDEPDNFPPFGSVLAKLYPQPQLPEYVLLPEFMSNNGFDLPGQRSGFLGPAFDPFVAGDPSESRYVPGFGLLPGVSAERLKHRREIFNALTHGSATRTTNPPAGLDTYYARAFDLLASPKSRQAFDLSQESPVTRERYGLPDRVDRSVEARKFGGLPHMGQSLLLARRLIESGVRLVTVCSGRRIDQAWDTHRQHFPLLKRSLIPYLDRGFSALLEDLSQRGLLDETLVIAMGEFGRTPKLGQITSGAGADAGGRDHWPHCYSVLMAGGGIRGGALFGASDRFAAYPARNPVTPEDIAATIYQALGIPSETRIRDSLQRPHSIALGEPIEAVFG
jgi:hypothetical protein